MRLSARALGGVCTTVGEPQNLLIASYTGWDFKNFLPNDGTGDYARSGRWDSSLALLLEKTHKFGLRRTFYPSRLRSILVEFDKYETERRSDKDNARLVIQAVAAIFLVFALAFHVAEVGIIGLTIIVLQTAFNGIVEEHKLGHAFEEALPFHGSACGVFLPLWA